MTASSPPPAIDLPPERPVETVTIALLRAVKDACVTVGADFVLAGATARDIQMWHRHGIKALIATRDVDVAVCAVSWEFHERLVELLVETGRFARDPKEQQKLLFRRLDDSAVSQLDLVPFGPLEAPRGQVAWPPGGDIVMTVLGFQEAVDTAEAINVGEGLVVPVVAIPVFVLLKLVAWNERRLRKNSDASDLLFIFRKYFYAGNTERVYEDAQDLLETYAFKAELAAAGMLGREARDAARPETREAVRAMFESRETYETLRGDLFARAGTLMLGELIEDSDELLAAFATQFCASSTT